MYRDEEICHQQLAHVAWRPNSPTICPPQAGDFWVKTHMHQTPNFSPFVTTVMVLPHPILASKKRWGERFKTDLLYLLSTIKELIMPLLVTFSAKFCCSPFESPPKHPQGQGLPHVLSGLVLLRCSCARPGAGLGPAPLLPVHFLLLPQVLGLQTMGLLLMFFSLCLPAASCPSHTAQVWPWTEPSL